MEVFDVSHQEIKVTKMDANTYHIEFLQNFGRRGDHSYGTRLLIFKSETPITFESKP
jgi:hypothetical protein